MSTLAEGGEFHQKTLLSSKSGLCAPNRRVAPQQPRQRKAAPYRFPESAPQLAAMQLVVVSSSALRRRVIVLPEAWL